MKFKIGDKVILKLDTVYGNNGIDSDRHNNVCTVTQVCSDIIFIRDKVYLWRVSEPMLELFIKPGQQLEFDFMEDE